MDQIINKPKLFHPSLLNQFSEMSFLVKFWGPVIELFFNANDYFIQWGDTISPYLSVINLHYKLDFRLIVKDFNNDELDVTTGELASHSSTTSSKMNGDFIKSAVTTKAHLNAALKRMPYIPPNKIKTIVAPMIQIMGLSCIVYGMNIIDKKVYTLQKLYSFTYPSTLREVKKGGMKALLKGFGLVEYQEWKKKNTIVPKTNIDGYISAIISNPDPEDEQDDEQEDEKSIDDQDEELIDEEEYEQEVE